MPPTKCMHGVVRRKCTECGGGRLCAHGVAQNSCPECGDSFTCVHGKVRRQCRDCKGSAFCEHNRRRTRCMVCGGGSLCLHGRRKERCKDCGGSAFCAHEKRKDKCPDCAGTVRQCEHGKPETRCGRCRPRGPARPVDTTCRQCAGTGRCPHCDGVGHCDVLLQTRKCAVCRAHARDNSYLHTADPFPFLALSTLPALSQPTGDDSGQEGLPPPVFHMQATPRTVKVNRFLLWENAGMS
eukprot:comp22714_c0_seq1/m.35273 comp22714_c0_seq1/g.35273  ORF comp22714_c0_seq1/g.35273 comp22714_c0_seq1/m.35273 type:complete len:239 (-) comp22714_c0_seq1:426-1142(-)